nr:hypothetical protein [Akkermansia glycaniphila]
MEMPTDEFVHVMLTYFMQRIRPMHREYHGDFIEDSQSAPPDETIVESFALAVRTGGHPSIEGRFYHVNDSAEYLSVIHPGNSVRKWQVRSYQGAKVAVAAQPGTASHSICCATAGDRQGVHAT